MKRRVVVTGMGIVTPLGCEVDECWNRVLAGESGIHDIQLFETSDLRVKIGGDLYDWDATNFLDKRELNRVDRFSQFAIVAAAKAVSDSGIDFSQHDKDRCGAIIGSGIGGLITIAEQMERLVLKGPSRVSPMTIPRLMLNAGGGNIAIKYGLRGPNFGVATACASATNAMGDALQILRDDQADVIVTGGSEAAITRIAMSAFSNMRALSESRDDPTTASRPFDAARAGFVLSEGAGVLVFEELSHAEKRGAPIYAEIIGYGTSCDAGHITQPCENGEGAALAMQLALNDARIQPQSVDYINAHGTGTPLGDKAETIAIKQVFGAHAHRLSISSTKSQLGHSLGASGGIELVLSIKAMQHSAVPPTINLDTPDPNCDLNYTPNKAQERALGIVMSNSFGFGGHNACIVASKM